MNKKNILLVLGLASALLVTGCPGTEAAPVTPPVPATPTAPAPAAPTQKTPAEVAAEAAAKAAEAAAKVATSTSTITGASKATLPTIENFKAITAATVWSYNYEQMCGIVADSKYGSSKGAFDLVKAAKAIIEKTAGYNPDDDAAGIVAPSADAAAGFLPSDAKLTELYTAQSQTDWSSEAKIVKDGKVTFAQVEQLFYNAVLLKVVKVDDFGFEKLVEYDLSWYFTEIILPTLQTSGKLDQTKITAFFSDAASVLPAARIIKQISKLGKDVYFRSKLTGLADPIFKDDKKTVSDSWDVNKNATNEAGFYAYLEARIIAFLGSTECEEAFKVAGLKNDDPSAYKKEAGYFTPAADSCDYTVAAEADQANKTLMMRYFNLLDLLSIGANEKTFNFDQAVAGWTIDTVVLLQHASATPRVKAATAASKPGSGSEWPETSRVVLFPVTGYTDGTKLKSYFGRRKTDIALIATGGKLTAFESKVTI